MHYYPRQENQQLYPACQQQNQMIYQQPQHHNQYYSAYHHDHLSIDRQQKYEHESQYETRLRPGDQSQYEHRSTQQTTVDLQRQQLTLDARAQQAHLATHTPNSARDRGITRARQDQVGPTTNHSHQTSIEVNDTSPTQTVNPMHTNATLTIIQNNIELKLAERAL